VTERPGQRNEKDDPVQARGGREVLESLSVSEKEPLQTEKIAVVTRTVGKMQEFRLEQRGGRVCL